MNHKEKAQLIFSITVLLLLGLSLTVLLQPAKADALIINIASDHLEPTSQKRNEMNFGVGYEWSRHQVGFYRNSRVMADSYSLYYKKRWWVSKNGYFHSDKGLSLYDNKGHYNWELKPILTMGTRLQLDKSLFAEANLAPKLLTFQIGFKLP